MTRLSILACALSFGCQASVNSQVSASTAGDAQASSDAQLSTSNASQAAPSSGTPSNAMDPDENPEPSPAVTRALFGARAGLHLAKGATANCRCLAVAIGLPHDQRMRWDGQVTAIDSNSQLVVALGSDGIDCPEATKDSLGASYHGYESVGSDVVIQVETGRMGRPLAGGAIIPKPASGGRLLVRPVDNKSPYGRSLDGKENACTVWTAP